MQYSCTALGLVSPALHAMPLLHRWHGRDLMAAALIRAPVPPGD